MQKRLYRNEHDKVIAGVGSGLADFFGIEVTTIRVLLVLFTFLLPFSGIVIYIVIWAVVPVNLDPSKRFPHYNQYFGEPPFSADPLTASDNQFNKFTQAANPNYWENPQNFKRVSQNEQKSRVIIGSILISLGVFFLLKKLGIIPYWISLYKFWPIVIIGIGIALIVKRKRKQEWNEFLKNTQESSVPPTNTVANEPEVNKENSSN
ncbi:MAG: PspC domain-containing protein [Pedobacter sp.]|nr:MAG: PspC domain-containing protein [Pedobacter sp.]